MIIQMKQLQTHQHLQMILLTKRPLEKQQRTEMVTSMTLLGYQVVKHGRNSVSIKVSWNQTKNIHMGN